MRERHRSLANSAGWTYHGPYLKVATPTSIVIRWRTEGTDPAITVVVNDGTTLGNLDSSANAAPQQNIVLGERCLLRSDADVDRVGRFPWR